MSAAVPRGLRSPTPLFARRLARGIALSDNPPGGASFGVSRMTLVAEALVARWRTGLTASTSACAWFVAAGEAGVKLAYCGTGGDLYTGSAGIALFLARLARAAAVSDTGLPAFARHAEY